ncbi:MAG: hypothetical protein OXG08_12670 [Gammaproteobacteria bacterium]|nr:hypothetical protein [Gammaproteobacteria bacterium]
MSPDNFPLTKRRIDEKSLLVVAVEHTHHNAHIAWSMIRHGTDYDPARQHLAKEPTALVA